MVQVTTLSGARRILLALAAAIVALMAFAPAGRAADPCAAPVTNPVACENSKPGVPLTDWRTIGNGDPTIQGYATQMSVNKGQTIQFKIKTPSTNYHIDILRLGYYNGDGARMIQANIRPTASLPQNQPACITDSTTGLIDCGNWGVSASYTVPSSVVSGVFIAHLVRDDTGGDSQIPFVVRDDASHSDMVVQTSDATWQAYNAYGGNSLYGCTVACPPGNPVAYKAAYAVSYNRPFDGTLGIDGGRSYLYYAEYELIRFIEANGYNVSYVASKDVDNGAALLQNHRLFISSGHDEYWSGNQRANVEAARDAGVNLAFFSGNEVFWKTRYGPSIDGANSASRTLTSYKETHFDSPVDPQEPAVWTGTWMDPRWSPPADGGRPQNALTGQLFQVNSGTSDIKVPAAYGKMRLWRNTQAAALTGTQTLTLDAGGGTLGYEWDIDADNGARPPGTVRLSSTTVAGTEKFTDFGSTVTTGTATHNLTLYRAPGGALVFGSGTVQWAWGLDNMNAWDSSTTDPSGNPPDRNVQQATVNLFGDMGVQPYQLLTGLQAASPSADKTAPVSTITAPASGANLTDGAQVTISGTATDTGGGVVAGVEVSTDNGATWHPATGTTSWTYSWTAHGSPTATIKTRAVDDSANLESPGAGRTVNISCECSIWGSGTTPSVVDAGDGNAVELGVKFKTDTFGVVTGIRFYKASTNTGTHIGSLWTAGGQRLAQVTFTGESASGWQTARFSSPVAIMPGTTYVASYYAPNGHYSISDSGFFYSPAPFSPSQLDSPPLHAIVARGTTTNGLYAYGPSGFPANTYQATNYYVDVAFNTAPAPGQATGATATGGPGGATVSWTAPTTGGPPTSYIVTPYLGTIPQVPTTVSGSPPLTTARVSGLTPGQSYTFRVTASNPAGDAPASAPTNAVTPTPVTAPGAPTGVQAAAISQTAQVKWTAPVNDGGQPITGYTVTPYIGTTPQAPVQTDGSTTATTVNNLTNGTAYTFRVAATNAIGTGADAGSNVVMPGRSLFDFATPAIVDSGDSNSVELGVKFKADAFGIATGVRFYKSAANTGTHTGSLWSTDGTRLATVTFTNESPSGWQQALFSTPVPIMAGTTYIVSYYAPNGRYSYNSPGFATGVDNGPLHAPANSADANGVFAYGSGGQFPDGSWNASNYWVDVTYAPAPAAGQATGVTATAGTGSATVNWNAPSSGGPVTKYIVTPYLGSTAQTPTTVTGSPVPTSARVSQLTGGQTYTFRVTASNPSGDGPASAASNAVTPDAGTAPSAPTNVEAAAADARAKVSWKAPADDGGFPISGYTVTPYIGSNAQTAVQVSASTTTTTITGLTNNATHTFKVAAVNSVGTGAAGTSNAVMPNNTLLGLGTPATLDAHDSNSVELGVKFSADTFGIVTGIRFYKSAANTGTHVGNLWTAGGTRLATATFTSETSTGWQEADFSTPVAITPGTTYIASYYAPNGGYSVTNNGFASALNVAPLHAPASSTSANGVFTYGGASAFPTDTWNAGNYFVDVLFAPQGAPGTVTGVTATAGASSATVNWNAPSTGGVATKYVVTPYVGATAQASTTVTGTPPATSATITGLTSQPYTFRVTASNPAGDGPASAASNAVTPTTLAPPTAPQNVEAAAADQSARVTWNAPSSAGGSPITGYTVTPYDGTTAKTPVQAAATARSASVSGLTNGTQYTFRVTATSNAGTSPDSTASNAVTPNKTIFGFATPDVVDSGDGGSVVLGVKFNADAAGVVTGLRFYKAAGNTGAHVGTLWAADGTLLRSATFSNETSSGWQEVDFAVPVSITPGTTYVASYLAPNGHYSVSAPAFTAAADNPPLHALSNSVSPNGLYAYSGSNVFPTNSWNASNYFVDVLFAPTP